MMEKEMYAQKCGTCHCVRRHAKTHGVLSNLSMCDEAKHLVIFSNHNFLWSTGNRMSDFVTNRFSRLQFGALEKEGSEAVSSDLGKAKLMCFFQSATPTLPSRSQKCID